MNNFKNKKLITAVLSVVLVAAIAVGGTLAYLYTITDKKTNVFAFTDNIKASLDEPSWDPDNGQDLTPGANVPKDPQITNTSVDAIDEYVAIKLVFTRGDGTPLTDAETATLLDYVTIDWSKTWTRIDGTATSGQQIYGYNEKIQPNVTSDPIFYSLTVKGSVTPDQQKWLAGDYGHTEACYEFGTCDCTVTYKHHERCKLTEAVAANKITAAQAAATVTGGTVGGVTCDCKASEVHESTCPSLNGHIKVDGNGIPTCGHTTLISGIGGFNIEVIGAAVQADQFANAAAAAPDLVTLLTK